MTPVPGALRERVIGLAILAAAALIAVGFVCAFIEPVRPLGVLVPVGLSAIALLGSIAARPR